MRIQSDLEELENRSEIDKTELLRFLHQGQLCRGVPAPGQVLYSDAPTAYQPHATKVHISQCP